MAKKLFGLSMFVWILIALVVLFFGFGVGRREGFQKAAFNCSTSNNQAGCVSHGCTWTWDSNGRLGTDGTCSGNGY
jgi:hypothetical protein